MDLRHPVFRLVTYFTAAVVTGCKYVTSTYSTTYSNVFQRSKKCLASKSDIVSLQHLRLELVI